MTSEADILNARILIVDDHECNTEVFEIMLSQAGYLNVSSTMDPTEVCALHQAKCFDLILLDLQMPGMDGFEVMEAVRAIDSGRSPSIVVLSAQPAHQARALQNGADDFVTKPFEIVELLGRIHRLLEGRLREFRARAEVVLHAG